MKIKLTKDEVKKILDSGDYIKGGFSPVSRINGGLQKIIFRKDDKHFMFTYLWVEYDGIEWVNEYEANEVVEAEKVVKYWKVVD